MASSTPRGISYPTSDDKIKDGSNPSALADDFAVLASSADAAMTAGVQEAKGAAAADASAKDAAIDAKATSAVSTANNALAVSSGASSDAGNAVDRVTALESAAGFGPSTPTDGTMANFIANPESLTAGALSGAIVDQGLVSQGLVSVAAHGSIPDGVSDNYAAFVAALAVTPTGGTLFVPPGKYFLSNTLVIDRCINLDCGRGGFESNGGGTLLEFASGKTGIWVKENAGGVRPSGWRVGPFDVTSRSTGAGSDIGILVTNGQGTLDSPSASGFGSHGIALLAGANSPYVTGNVNNSVLIRPRAYGNRGDGILVQGNDSQAHIIIKPDVVANYGTGLNLDRCASVEVVAPHADQMYNGSVNAYRDNGSSNVWRSVYSEGSVRFLVDTNSLFATITTAQYGRPDFVDNTVGKTALWVDAELGTRKQVRVNGTAGGAAALDVDQFGTGVTRLRQILPTSKDLILYGNSSDTLFTAASKFRVGVGAGDPIITVGDGSPEGVVNAPKGSMYQRRDGGAGTSFYIKEAGTGLATGWVAK